MIDATSITKAFPPDKMRMLQQFNLYIIIGLIVLLLAVSGGFFAYHRIASADIALLEQQTITYRLAVDEQARTIEAILADR